MTHLVLGDGEAQGPDTKDPRDPREDGVLLEVLLLRRRPPPRVRVHRHEQEQLHQGGDICCTFNEAK